MRMTAWTSKVISYMRRNKLKRSSGPLVTDEIAAVQN